MLSGDLNGLDRESDSSASFAHSLSVAPLNTENTIHNISLALNNGLDPGHDSNQTHDTDPLMSDAIPHDNSSQQPESRMAVAELLVSLAHSSPTDQQQQPGSSTVYPGDAGEPSQPTPMYRNAVDYVAAVKRAYFGRQRQTYALFMRALEEYHAQSLPLDQLVKTVMALFQDEPELLMGFKEFLPEAQGLMNQLVPPMMYSDYKDRTAASQPSAPSDPPALSNIALNMTDSTAHPGGYAAADFLSLIKERSQQEPDMYQHMITLLRKFQKDHSYATLYFYASIVLRYHPHLLQRFHKFLPTAPTGVEVTEPKVISKAPPQDLLASPDFSEAKDFVQTVKYAAKNDMSMYDRFISALEKYQRTGWTIDQVYSEVSLIFWNHPDALQGFKRFITTLPQQQ